MESDLQLWKESSQAWIDGQGEAGDRTRQFLDPYLLERIGDVEGLRSLDIGCGSGRFSRVLARCGAEVFGLDPIPDLLTEANKGVGEYLLGSATSLPFRDQSFDLVVFYLVLIDVLDFGKAISEATRVLKPNGQMLVVNITSMSTASTAENMWIEGEGGVRIARRIENYAVPRGNIEQWSGIRVRNYHRPLSQYIQAFLASGLRLEWFDEPTGEGRTHVSEDWIQTSKMCPLFNLMIWKKDPTSN